MEYRSAKFLQLAQNLVETFNEAVQQALHGRGSVSETEITKIYSVIKSYMPKLLPVFENICENCPSYAASYKLTSTLKKETADRLSESLHELIEFVSCVTRDSQPLRNRIFLMSLSDFSQLYCSMSPNGRKVIDGRIDSNLSKGKDICDKMLFIGNGVFLFYFSSSDEHYLQAHKNQILDIVCSLVGERRQELEQHSISGMPSEGSPSTLEAIFRQDVDIESHLKKKIENITNSLNDTPNDGTAEPNGRHQFFFEMISRQLSFHYRPVWDSRSSQINIYFQETFREIEPGVQLEDADSLTRGNRDPFHYRFQLHKIDHALCVLLDMETQHHGNARLPSVLVPISMASFATISAEQFQQDMIDIIGHHSGERLILCLSDVDEHLPRNLFVKIISIIRKMKIRIFCKISLRHDYIPLLAGIEGMTNCLDVSDIMRFGFDPELLEQIIAEFGRSARARRLLSLIMNVDSSFISSTAYKAGYTYLLGKVVGERRNMPGLVSEIGSSRILMKS
jgi:hypothetical protein